MDRYVVPHGSFSSSASGFGGGKEVRDGFKCILLDKKDAVFCPKPRRVGQLISATDGIRPHRLYRSHQADLGDLASDLILTKDCYGDVDQFCGISVCSSPPYFSGSPPIRAANPIVHDARFLEQKQNNPLIPPLLSPSSPISPSASARKLGCNRSTTNFGLDQAKIRIEGFDCLNRDRSCGGIPAFA